MGSRDELQSVRSLLVQAELTEAPARRWLTAYAAALKVAAVVLRTGGPCPGRMNAWQLLGRVAPGLAEWAGYFHALQPKREVVAAGAVALVSVREADDLVRDVGLFCDAVEWWLGGAMRAARRQGRARTLVAGEQSVVR